VDPEDGKNFKNPVKSSIFSAVFLASLLPSLFAITFEIHALGAHAPADSSLASPLHIRTFQAASCYT
jgi:hypothetical protein